MGARCSRTVFHGEPYSEALLGDMRRAGDAAQPANSTQFHSRDGDAPSWNRAPSGRCQAGEVAETLEAFVELLPTACAGSRKMGTKCSDGRQNQ